VTVNSSSRIIRFSTFEVNLHTGELRQRGQKVKLQEQPLQVLAALLERPGEIVTREELRSKLWPADTFVDFDHSLNAAIKRLRDALGESAEAPIFVETLARRGYRFIAPVVQDAAPQSEAPDRLTRSEFLIDLNDMHRYGRYGWAWSGLAPDDSALLVRDVSTDEIYSLDVELP
jgi:DNA-binding winged helix-turn-helix (wHTH) protein